LVALVGLVLAFFPGLLAKASKSTSASSVQDVARAVQINFSSTQSYGTGFDSLLNQVTGNTLYTKLPTASLNQMAVATITTNDSAALASLGITSYRHLTNTLTGDATFAVATAATTTIVGATSSVATITDSTVQNSLRGNYNPVGTPTYIVFGLGKGASIIGAGGQLQDAPVRAGADASENPTTSYGRFGLVFMTDDSGTGGARKARFIGACSFNSTGISTAENNLQQYYAN
jgi:hypothetical protein